MNNETKFQDDKKVSKKDIDWYCTYCSYKNSDLHFSCILCNSCDACIDCLFNTKDKEDIHCIEKNRKHIFIFINSQEAQQLCESLCTKNKIKK